MWNPDHDKDNRIWRKAPHSPSFFHHHHPSQSQLTQIFVTEFPMASYFFHIKPVHPPSANVTGMFWSYFSDCCLSAWGTEQPWPLPRGQTSGAEGGRQWRRVVAQTPCTRFAPARPPPRAAMTTQLLTPAPHCVPAARRCCRTKRGWGRLKSGRTWGTGNSFLLFSSWFHLKDMLSS